MLNVDWASYTDEISRAALVTLEFAAAGFAGAVVLGLLVALLRRSKYRLVRMPLSIYVEAFKNTPLLTQIFIMYFGFASIGVIFSPFLAGSLTLMLFYGAYLSEIFRAGIEGVSGGQREAALAVGLSPSRAYRSVVLPQAARLALPATGNMLVDLLKATSLMTVIAGSELMTVARNVTAETFQAMEVYVGISVVYFVLAYPLSQLVLWYERQLKQGRQFSLRRRRAERHLRDVLAAGAS